MPGKVFSQSARIDIATNFASFDSIDFSIDFPDFLKGDFGVRHLLTLIHEATHHWCLITPVGTALAARTFRTYHDALLVAANSDRTTASRHERQGLLDASIWASRTLTNYFVPLLEGLALYAEWRACPGEGGTFSRPFDLFRMLTESADVVGARKTIRARVTEVATGNTADERAASLLNWLSSDDARPVESALVFETVMQLSALRRKAEERRRLKMMLSSPIDPRDGSYQLGYLFVCALETLCDAHASTDLLLAFLRDHFFGDYELAALVLDEHLPPADLYTKVREVLQAKVFELVTDPAAAAERVRKWGAETGYAPVTRSSVDDFFGRPPSAVDAGEVGAEYGQRLHAFCKSVGSPIVPAQTLEEFLTGGRMLMPLGSSDAVLIGIENGRQILKAADGARIAIVASELGDVPAIGETVTISMLVNVAAPGLFVTLGWDDHLEAIALDEDSISKPMIELVYRQSKRIGEVVEAGQSVIGMLRRVLDDTSEPLEQFVDEHLASEAAAKDVVQIYRAAIAHAFATGDAEVKDSSWRAEAFRPWQPRGVSTILTNQATFGDFLRICGMPVMVRLDGAHLLKIGAAKSEADVQSISDELFAAMNGVPRARYDDIAERANALFESKGLRVFGTSPSGSRISLL